MTSFLVLRETQDGIAHVVGVTPDTTLGERAIADHWVASREIDEPVRLHFADITKVKTIDAKPEVIRRATTAVVAPAEAFKNPQVIELPEAPA